MTSFVHHARLQQLEESYRPPINAMEAECAGLIFLNRYLMAVLSKLEPNHPLLEVGFREKLSKWGGFAYSDAPGDFNEKIKVAVEAGLSFSIPKFDTRLEMIQRTRPADPEAADRERRAREFTLATKQWREDMDRGIVAPRPKFETRRPNAPRG